MEVEEVIDFGGRERFTASGEGGDGQEEGEREASPVTMPRR